MKKAPQVTYGAFFGMKLSNVFSPSAENIRQLLLKFCLAKINHYKNNDRHDKQRSYNIHPTVAGAVFCFICI